MGICVCEATRFEFNLNNHIRFKPTKLGKTIFNAHWMPYSKNGEERELEVDELGWAEMQLWEFMNIYGSFFCCGMNLPLETTVLLINETAEQLQALKDQGE